MVAATATPTATGALPLTQTAALPADSPAVTVSGTDITLAEGGLYEISYDLDYGGTAQAGATSSLFVGGEQVESTVRQLENRSSVSATYFVNAAPDTVVQLQISDDTGITGGNAVISVKRYGEVEAQ